MQLGSAGYIVGALAIAAPLYVVLAYNHLVRARNMLQEGWSGIDVQLRRRADLVPNLIGTVKGYAAHEHSIFNLGYFTWVEQQGVGLADFEARRDQRFWRSLRDLLRDWDEGITDFNRRTGAVPPP